MKAVIHFNTHPSKAELTNMNINIEELRGLRDGSSGTGTSPNNTLSLRLIARDELEKQ